MKKENEAGLEILLNQSFKQVDRWAKQEEFREDILLQSVKKMGENLKQNQADWKEIAEQFSSQLQKLETVSREQFLTVMAPFRNMLPMDSFEQIDEQLNDIHMKTAKIFTTPFHYFSNEDYLDGYMSALERFIEIRRNGREKLVENVKETSSVMFRNQSIWFQMAKSQMKNVFFPFSRYLDQSNGQA